MRKPPDILTTDAEQNPLWFKDAVIYELHVRSFFDSDGDGIGDFKGLRQKLDYLQDLGVTTLWLLPFCPSPLRDDGYDISDYTNIHRTYGSLKDFREFIKEAHRRELRVITELVLNHTSDQHAWFQRARRAKAGSIWRDFYVWSQDPKKYADARIIFKDFETSNWTWDPLAQAYYWHRFYSHQPDLNYENPAVRKAMFKVVDFWFSEGVDGLRLDAVPYLYEEEGTHCENLPQTHRFLKELRRHVDQHFEARLLLGEANQWPEDAVSYFGKGDELHMAYHFPLMPRLFMAIQMESRFPILDILEQTPLLPENCQWAIFLRNHDELTLEMVTDEERDYMYRAYASDPQAKINLGIRRRLAPLLGNNRRKIELMNVLLFTLLGTPVIYYGDEIGMGDNIYLGDRNGVRTPMQWSADRNAGFSRASPQRLYLPVTMDPEYHYEAINVEAQQNNPHSLLWWSKRLIALRKRYKALSQGSLEFLQPNNPKVLAFLRILDSQTLLVLANLSRMAQSVQLKLEAFQGKRPVELFGQTPFPRIEGTPYSVTLAPHSFFLFEIQKAEQDGIEAAQKFIPPLLKIEGGWEDALEEGQLPDLEEALPSYLKLQRWFASKGYKIRSARLRNPVRILQKRCPIFLAFLEVDYIDHDTELYFLPLALASQQKAEELRAKSPELILAELHSLERQEKGVLYDAIANPNFCELILKSILRRFPLKSYGENFAASFFESSKKIRLPDGALPEPKPLQGEQSNTSILYGDSFVLKLIRKLDHGENPDLEIGKFLAREKFPHAAPLLGALEYELPRRERITLALLNEFVPNQGNAWQSTLDHLSQYYEQILAHKEEQAFDLRRESLLDLAEQPLPASASERIGSYPVSAQRLGEVTAQLHLALSEDSDDPAFAPEPFNFFSQRSLYQSMRHMTRRSFALLRENLDRIDPGPRGEAQEILALEGGILQHFSQLLKAKVGGQRIRCHGDYHLGQVLNTGKDFVVIDFEGEPRRALSERKLKRSPLVDVAGMIRSFHYAAYAALMNPRIKDIASPEKHHTLRLAAEFWHQWVSSAFLRAYLLGMRESPLLPKRREDIELLLSIHLLEKAVYELGYELNQRPDWLAIPLRGILQLAQQATGGKP